MVSKKGNAILDSFTWLTVIFVFLILSIVGFKVMNEITTSIQDDQTLKAEQIGLLSDINSRMPDFIDGAIVTLFIFLWLLLLAASFQVDSHPFFFIISILALVALLVVAGFVSNAYDDLATDPSLSAEISLLPMSTFIFNNLVPILLVIALSVMIVLYAKSR